MPLKNGGGWGSVALGSGMIGRLLAVAWPDGTNVMASFRKAT